MILKAAASSCVNWANDSHDKMFALVNCFMRWGLVDTSFDARINLKDLFQPSRMRKGVVRHVHLLQPAAYGQLLDQ